MHSYHIPTDSYSFCTNIFSQKGVRTAEGEEHRKRIINSILDILHVDKLSDAFPPGTFPAEDVGDHSLANLRMLAKNTADLAEFREVLRIHCQDENGAVTLRYSHTDRIRKNLKNALQFQVCKSSLMKD